MKKYLAAGAVAIMVFAFAAMAASFNVNDTVLAVGEGDVSSCAENAEITAWLYEAQTGTAQGVRVEFDDAACDGLRVYATPLNAAGGALATAGSNVIGGNTVVTFGNNTGSFGIDGVLVPVTQIESIRLGVDQGF